MKISFPKPQSLSLHSMRTAETEMCQVMHNPCSIATESHNTSKCINVRYGPYAFWYGSDDLYRMVVEDHRGRLWVQTGWYVIHTAQQPLGLKKVWERGSILCPCQPACHTFSATRYRDVLKGQGSRNGRNDFVIVISSLNVRENCPWWALVVVAWKKGGGGGGDSTHSSPATIRLEV